MINYVVDETASYSRSILSDVLFELNQLIFQEPLFTDVTIQNKFYEFDLRQEIINKYQFTADCSFEYQDKDKLISALKATGITFTAGGAIAVGTTLVAGLSASSLAPLPVAILIGLSLVVALTEYFYLSPNRSQNNLLHALNQYLEETEKQLTNWFNEIEKYFFNRVEDFKKNLENE